MSCKWLMYGWVTDALIELMRLKQVTQTGIQFM